MKRNKEIVLFPVQFDLFHWKPRHNYYIHWSCRIYFLHFLKEMNKLTIINTLCGWERAMPYIQKVTSSLWILRCWFSRLVAVNLTSKKNRYNIFQSKTLSSRMDWPELLPNTLHSVSINEEHLCHVICQHFAGVTYIHSCLCVREKERVTEQQPRGSPDASSTNDQIINGTMQDYLVLCLSIGGFSGIFVAEISIIQM